MSFARKQQEEINRQTWMKLHAGRGQIVTAVKAWMSDALALQASTQDLSERAEVATLREAFLNDMAAALAPAVPAPPAPPASSTGTPPVLPTPNGNPTH